MHNFKYTFFTCIFSTLVACGGGGGGAPAASGPVASAETFQLRQAVANDFSDTKTYPFKLSGTSLGLAVTGSGAITYSPISVSMFEGASARMKTQNVSLTASIAGPSGPLSVPVPATSETVFVDSASVPIGFRNGTAYGVPLVPLTIPATAKVGDAGNFGTVTIFSSSAKTVISGFNDYSFSVTADTASTAILSVSLTQRNSARNVTGTQVSTYRITPTGSITPLAISGTSGSTAADATSLTFTF
jgi:hypothetical protein